MSDTKIYGYLLTIKWGTKIIKGLETAGLKIKANFEPILLKADGGVPDDDFIDFDTEMSIGGKTLQRDGAQSGTHEDFETLRVAASVGAQLAFTYGRTTQGNQQVTGYGRITDWGEDSGSEKKMGNYSGSFKAKKGTVIFGAQA